MAGNTIKIPQVLNAALAAGVYVCLAQRSGSYFVNPHPNLAGDLPAGLIAGGFVFLWNTKNFVDDYKAFEHEPDAAFRLGPTILFSAAAYTSLAVTASLLFRGLIPIYTLGGYFLILTAWSTVSYVRRKGLAPRPGTEDVANAKRKQRGTWALIYPVCALALIGAALLAWPCALAVATLLVLAIYVMDLRFCKTLHSTNEVGL